MDQLEHLLTCILKGKGLTQKTFCHVALQELTKDLDHTESELNNTLDYGRKLSSNKDLSDRSRQAVSDDVVLLEEKWKALMKGSQEEYARYIHSSYSGKLPAEQQEKKNKKKLGPL